jgi:glycosyltransferase involved in cell wall biosynthesis
MRTAFICFYEAYPPASGAASVTYNCARYSPGERFLIQSFVHQQDDKTVDGVHILSFPWPAGRIEKLAQLRRRTDDIAKMCKQIGPDVIVLEGASWALYHWLLMRRLRRQGAARIVYHAHNVEYLLRQQKHGALVCAITRWAERKVIRGADLVFAVSEVDQRQIEALYGRRPEILPNGVDADRFGSVPPAAVDAVRSKYGLAGNVVLFMGLYAYRPNTEAVDALVREIFPAVRRQFPDARLAVIGGEIPYREPWLIAPGQIPFEELPAFVSACRLGVAPIFSGSGTRLKILEYLAAGLPVVATPKGAEGLDLQDGSHLRLASPSAAVAQAIVELIENPANAVQLGRAGQERVRSQYSWPIIMRNCWNILDRSANARERASWTR